MREVNRGSKRRIWKHRLRAGESVSIGVVTRQGHPLLEIVIYSALPSPTLSEAVTQDPVSAKGELPRLGRASEPSRRSDEVQKSPVQGVKTPNLPIQRGDRSNSRPS